MEYKADTISGYIAQLPEERQVVIKKLKDVIETHIPQGFEAGINYKMIGFYVPHSLYPDGYHCDTSLPLPFINLASQKNFVALYHMGIYSNPELYKWFTTEYPKHCKRKLDMGKSCIRFKYMDDIPYKLIAELVTKITVEDWIATYESAIKKQ